MWLLLFLCRRCLWKPQSLNLEMLASVLASETVLDKVNLKIYENQITTIMGKSGAGKEECASKHFIGLLSPDAGTIFFLGRPLDKMRREKRIDTEVKLVTCFKTTHFSDSMTVFDNIALPLRQKTTNLNRKEIEQKVMARIEQTELTEAADKYPSELSGGMQKRVALARSLVTDPKIVLFDEPTAGQDPIRKNAILSMIAHYRKKFGFMQSSSATTFPMFFSSLTGSFFSGRGG